MEKVDDGLVRAAVCCVSILILLDPRLVLVAVFLGIPLIIMAFMLWSTRRADAARESRDSHDRPY